MAPLVAALLVILLLPLSDGSLNVLMQGVEELSLMLRAAIVVDETLLEAARPKTSCSSDDGPWCLLDALASIGSSFGEAACGSEGRRALGRDEDTLTFEDINTRHLVDGLVPPLLDAAGGHPELRAWLASESAQDALGAMLAKYYREQLRSTTLPPELGVTEQLRSAQRRARRGTAWSRTRCFRLSFDAVPPWIAYLPRKFAAGLPPQLGATWDGLWELSSARVAERWRTEIVLRSDVGYLRFERPCVVHELLVHAPGHEHSLICGFLAGTEQWCSKPLSAGYARIGDSLHAVDAVAFSSRPAEGLHVAFADIRASLDASVASSWFRSSEQQRVVLLRRLDARTFEATNKENRFVANLVTASPDAAIWDLNELLRGGVQFRDLTDTEEIFSTAVASHAFTPEATRQMRQGLRPRTSPSWMMRQLSRHVHQQISAFCASLQRWHPKLSLLNDAESDGLSDGCKRVVFTALLTASVSLFFITCLVCLFWDGLKSHYQALL